MLAGCFARAAPDEITVFTDELERPGHTGYELHLNYTPKARCIAAYPGEQAPCRVMRLMPEIVHGLAATWNLGVHLPFSYSRNTHQGTFDGVKLRLHNLNVVGESKQHNFFYGANYELALYSERITPSKYSGEIRGIVGANVGTWKFTLNPIVNTALNKSIAGRGVNFELFGQALHTIDAHVAVGMEHYASPGRLSRASFDAISGQISYLVANYRSGNRYFLHIGIGHGWTDASDKRVFKALIGLPF